MEIASVIAGLLALHWALKEYDLLGEKDVSEREWAYFLRAKYALYLWAATIMASSMAVEKYQVLVIILSVGSCMLLLIFGPKLAFRLFGSRPSK